ncbi:protein of unknown function [Streptomyces murinus]
MAGFEGGLMHGSGSVGQVGRRTQRGFGGSHQGVVEQALTADQQRGRNCRITGSSLNPAVAWVDGSSAWP